MDTHFSHRDYDMVGGLVFNWFGHAPKRGDTFCFDGLKVQMLRADSRRIHTSLVEELPEAETEDQS